MAWGPSHLLMLLLVCPTTQGSHRMCCHGLGGLPNAAKHAQHGTYNHPQAAHVAHALWRCRYPACQRACSYNMRGLLETSAADILQPEASRNLLLNLERIGQRRLCHTGTSPIARLSFPEPLLVTPSTTYPHTQAAHAVEGMPPQPTSPYVTSKLSKRAGPLQNPATQHSSVEKSLM